MRNPYVEVGAATMNAIGALRLKRHQLRPTADGVEILQPGKPTLLLRYSDAEQFNNQTREAECG